MGKCTAVFVARQLSNVAISKIAVTSSKMASYKTVENIMLPLLSKTLSLEFHESSGPSATSSAVV